jgi:hypothetical protein
MTSVYQKKPSSSRVPGPNPDTSDHSSDENDDNPTQIRHRKPPSMYSLDRIQKSLLIFCLSLLNHPTGTDEYECPFVVAMAVLGVKELGFHSPDTYTSTLSSLLKISRFFVLRFSFESTTTPHPNIDIDSDSDSDSDDDSVDLEGLEDLPGKPLDRIKYLVNRFMIRGSHTPIDWLLNLRAYGMTISRNSTMSGHIDWNGDNVSYGNVSFSLSDFRGFLHGLISSTRTILFDDLLFSQSPNIVDKIPEIPWSNIFDNPLDSTPNMSFLNDSRTDLGLDQGTRWLWTRIMTNITLKSRFRKTNDEWKIPRLEKYFSTIYEFLEKLLILFHLLGGQPARAPEILSVRCFNSINSNTRNIFFDDELISFVTFYHKGFAISGSTKIIHRYLPREIGELLVYYQWLILPFQQRIALTILENPMSEYLFQKSSGSSKPPTTIDSDQFRGILRRETLSGLGIALNPSQYRHIAIGISRKFLDKPHHFQPDDDPEDEPEDSDYEDDIIDLQAGHSSKTAGTVYGRGILESKGEVFSTKKRFRNASIVSLDVFHYFTSI